MLSAAITVAKTYTLKGDDSGLITCTVDNIRAGHTSSPVSTFTFSDGTKTWPAGQTEASVATVSVSHDHDS